jgi:hypothetical protein
MIARCASDSIVTGEMLIVRDVIAKCIFAATVKHNLNVNTQRTPVAAGFRSARRVYDFREKVSSEGCCIFVIH